ncbi:MAG TPA: putative DNA modification/repair radical SAM protein [Clostridia bacterium]|nr:putative DNA modification/repair radical SAM protein [Clostridia bacterium]
MDLQRKLQILADAAKYDASCASNGGEKRSSRGTNGVGSVTGCGICHSFTPDGRCVSLLKVLLTNFCIFDCLYCVNRVSSDVPRARFTVDEVVRLTLDFYKRNYIEGLFLSSGIIRDPDYTMEQLVAVARKLRVEHEFRGYIHLKTIPEASPGLIEEAGRYADRISINVELPTRADLQRLAPEKNVERIESSMAHIRHHIDAAQEERRSSPGAPAFAAAGQSTQMVVGATEATDDTILQNAASLYSRFRLKRVYYTAFSPIPCASSKLPSAAPPLAREHRLYQADWLMRFYGFTSGELTSPAAPNLDLRIDPKLAWALRNRHLFPVNVNTAGREVLLRVPGFGVKNVTRILQTRQWSSVRLSDLIRLRVPMRKTMPFIETADYCPHRLDLESEAKLRERFAPPGEQLELFAGVEPSVLNGQL